MVDPSLRFATIDRLARAVRGGDLDPAEWLETVLRDLETTGRSLGAIAEVTPERAGRALRALLASGSRARRGPLWGIPFGVKDIYDTAGIPTRWGAPPYRDRVPDDDATVIRQLDAAGAILAAKLSLIQLAGAGGYRSPAASLHGPCANPWRAGHWSGGSSSGSAAAVGAGLLPFSLGSETTGSVVIPAAFCGITGYRPTWGAASRAGVMSVAWSLDKVGILARSAADCRQVMSALGGRDPRDPTSADWRIGEWKTEPVTIGLLEPHEDRLGVAAERFEAALADLRRCGVRFRRIELPEADARRVMDPLLAGETAQAHAALARDPGIASLVGAAQRAGLRRALRLPAADYAAAAERRLAVDAAVRDVFRRVDLIASPTIPAEAPRLSTDLGRWPPRRRHLGVFGAVSGLPGVSVPMGPGPTGLPLGLSLIGARFDDARVLGVAARFQQETAWHLQHPVAA